MAFQIKSFSSIVASMINLMRATQQKITDFSVGSVARTLVEAPASEVDELYQQMFHGLREAIPVSIYNSFEFPRLDAVPASGQVRFSLPSAEAEDVIIPAGTRVKVPGGALRYATLTDATIPAGNTQVTVFVAAESSGAAGNTAASTVTEIVDAIDPVSSVTNLTVFSNGRDEETDSERKVRFQGFISTLARGTVSALRYGASLAYIEDAQGNVTERVQAVAVVEPFIGDPSEPIALVEVYVHNGAGSTTGALVQRTKDVLHGYYDSSGAPVPGWKAAGVKLDVYAATEITVGVLGSIEVLSGFDPLKVEAAVQNAITEYLQGLGIGETAVLAELVAAAMETDGVYNVSFSSPVADVTVLRNEKVMPGAVSVSPA